MNREILRFVDTIHRDKQVDKEVIFLGIELALVSAAQKRYGAEEDIEVRIDRSTGEISATMNEEELSPADMGRIAALNGKQVLFQKIREAEREVVYNEYKPKVGELLTGTVQSKKPGGVLILSLAGAEGFLPRSEQSPAETFNEGDRIKVVLAEVNLLPNRVQLLCSRSSPELVRALFELEIPEVADYVVEVKAVSREPGFRTKIAVTTYDSNVDCVGACVGVKGSRIRNIVEELFGEKIDIVRWNESIEVLIVESLRPAEIASLDLDFESKSAIVYVRPDQQSLAIGRRGQNVRLGSKLTGWDFKITPVSEEEIERMRQEGGGTGSGGSSEGATTASNPALDRLFSGAPESENRETTPAPAEEVEPALTQRAQSAMDALFTSAEADEAEASDASDVEGSSDDGDAPASEPVRAKEEFDLEALPGVGIVAIAAMKQAGLDSIVSIRRYGEAGLAALDGISPETAKQITEHLDQLDRS